MKIFESDNWLITRCCYGKEETIVRFRSEMPTRERQLANPIMVVLRWRYRGKKDGMPSTRVYSDMRRFEDALESLIEDPGLATQVASLTGGNRKTWRYFLHDKSAFLTALNPLLQQFQAARIEVLEFEDPAWDGLDELLPLVESASAQP